MPARYSAHVSGKFYYTTSRENVIEFFMNTPQLSPYGLLRSFLWQRRHGRTAGGDWWSDASYSATGGRDLSTDPTGVYPQGYNYRGIGFAVRCVVREG